MAQTSTICKLDALEWKNQKERKKPEDQKIWIYIIAFKEILIFN